MRDLVVLGGSSHPSLTRTICRNLTIEQGEVSSRKFSNGETSLEIQDSVREKDVFIVQSGCGDVNDNFIELLIMIAACKTASAKRVTAVLPLFPYSRQPDSPHAAGLTGAPSISTKKEQYTYESVPGTPGPFVSKNSDTFTSDSDSHTPPPTLNLGGKSVFSGLKPQVERTQSYSSKFFTPKSIVTNSASTNLPPVDAYGKTESGYKQWIAQNGTLIANLLVTAGADRLITMDLHDPQFQGFFNIPVDNLYSRPLLKHYILDYIPNYQECVIVSPDSGGAKRATAVADAIGCSFALIHKERRAKVAKNPPSTAASSSSVPMSASNTILSSSNTMVATTMLVGDVRDKVCVLIDDLVDTSYTITRAAKLLKDQGAKYVYALVTHGVFSGDAINRVNKSAIDKVITTNSVPQSERMKVLGSDKFEVLDVSRILAESIRRIHNGESVSMLFDHGW
ncbi:phosphoribosylpyrophosphate synthetase [Scheffersomyces stipitis CBS 6054]|uniref:ribose-phosphate diphosphokinase n=1 Tax=Scheffersomyces stipitis (strain ATCC 58785 / CBS 6054 / NBRC 10063 / NRRL Y-11545) TaxID=322104 RepID=A3LVW1_PICST|nr:phosphoribosylpyrophosphate synthetase [Scheffersomyces stipitis CBS 6054]ABN66853.2 phosphoribosylpyrophosphate synthetase [Scheffersomyces stipitis CBS 6054]